MPKVDNRPMPDGRCVDFRFWRGLLIRQERNKHYLFAMLAVDAKAKIYQDKIYPTVGGYGQ